MLQFAASVMYRPQFSGACCQAAAKQEPTTPPAKEEPTIEMIKQLADHNQSPVSGYVTPATLLKRFTQGWEPSNGLCMRDTRETYPKFSEETSIHPNVFSLLYIGAPYLKGDLTQFSKAQPDKATTEQAAIEGKPITEFKVAEFIRLYNEYREDNHAKAFDYAKPYLATLVSLVNDAGLNPSNDKNPQ